MRRFAPLLALLPLLLALTPALAASRPQAAATAAFTSYYPPVQLGRRAAEPTLGVDPKTGAVLFQSGTETLRVTDFGKGGRGTSTWVDASPGLATTTSFDPILETDAVTGRDFVSHLVLACSLSAFSDDDGRTWTEVPLGCGAGTLFDHQTVGTGPFVDGGVLQPTGDYPRAVYYCAQDIATARCSTSLDGGETYLPSVPVYTADPATNCGGLFGHLKTARDGTAYLPPTSCDKGTGEFATGTTVNPLQRPGAALAVTEDNGLTWTMRYVPGSTTGNAGHPSLGVGSDGTVYYAWGSREGGSRTDAGGPPTVAVSTDRGQTWTKPARLGVEHGIRNTKFVTTVAGDGDRAAVAFLGTATSGDDQDAAFRGVWRLYVSMTYDRGRTWRTVDATPENPVQVGSICTSGVFCLGNTRNLLDFNDVVIDNQGRVLAAIADGCPHDECGITTRQARAVVVRQEQGRGLLRAFDRVLARR